MPAPVTDQVRLPLQLSEQAQGGFGFMTTIVKTGSGSEQRISHWDEPLGMWTIQIEGAVAGVQMQNFFMPRRGSARGFLFQMPQLFAVSTPDALVQITPATWQLVKRFRDTAGYEQIKTIYKPAFDDSVHIWNGGTEITSGFTVDYGSGIVTFTSPPGYTPAATFNFDIPVRLRDDQQNVQFNSAFWHQWGSIVIDEMRGTSP